MLPAISALSHTPSLWTYGHIYLPFPLYYWNEVQTILLRRNERINNGNSSPLNFCTPVFRSRLITSWNENLCWAKNCPCSCNRSDLINFMFCWPCISIYACNEAQLMHYLSSFYWVTVILHVSGLLVAHHQEVAMYLSDDWYVLYVLVDCLLAWLEWNSHPGPTKTYSTSQLSHTGWSKRLCSPVITIQKFTSIVQSVTRQSPRQLLTLDVH
jgi:hypothetical protein